MTDTAGERPLTRGQRRFLALLSSPALGLSLAITTIGAFLPVLLQDRASSLVTGVLIGLEGIVALFMPVVLTRATRGLGLRGRLRVLVAAAVAMGVALVLLPVVQPLALVALALLGFHLAYFGYLGPYWALYPALVPEHMRGRSQGAMGVWREVGLGVGLVGGGLLVATWEPLPFVLAAVLVVVLTVAVAVGLPRSPEAADGEASGGTDAGASRSLRAALAVPGPMRLALAASALWETALGAIRTFVVLFITVGVGRSVGETSALLALVVPTVLLAAVVGGKLADRHGHLRVLWPATVAYGLGLLLPVFTTSTWMLLAVPVIGFAAGIVMTLPYSLLLAVTPADREDDSAGLYGVSRGVGLLAGPLLAGAAITGLGPWFEGTDGYAAMWLVAAAAVLGTLPLLRAISASR